jgi:hypothetical protein
MIADQKALATKGLDSDAKTYYENQEKSAQKQERDTERLIREMHKLATDPKLDGESISKLAKENASAIVASGLTAAQIGAAVGSAIHQHIKTPKHGGPGTPVFTGKGP